MKKLMAAILSLILVAVIALPAAAQGRRAYSNQSYSRRYDNSRNNAYNRQQRTNYDYNGYDDRSFWEKHRDKITTAGGVLGGAILGSIIGGKKGAAIGAIAGGGGAAVYTYKIRNKDRRY